MRHTLATAQTRKQVETLVKQIETERYPGLGKVYATRWGNITVSVTDTDSGEKVLSGVTAGGKWSVQVSADIAQHFNLPLWKDITV